MFRWAFKITMKLELEKLEAALEEERDKENGSGARQEEEEKQ